MLMFAFLDAYFDIKEGEGSDSYCPNNFALGCCLGCLLGNPMKQFKLGETSEGLRFFISRTKNMKTVGTFILWSYLLHCYL